MLRKPRSCRASRLLTPIVRASLMLLVSCSTTPFTDYDQAKNLSDAGQYRRAIVVYSRSINLLPNNPDPYLGRGYAYENLGEYQKALSDYSQVIVMKPKDPQAYFVRGLLYDLMYKTEEAIQDYSMVINLKPHNGDAYYYRGMDWEKLGDTNAAKADYRLAVAYGRVDAEARLKAIEGSEPIGEKN